MLRLLMVAIAFGFAGAASAQENVSIPFAPTLPARYAISEMRSMSADGEERVTHSNYTLELRAPADGGDGFDAALTVTSTDNDGLHAGAENLMLVYFPVLLSLENDGRPHTVRNWQDARAAWLRRARLEDDFAEFSSTTWLEMGPENGAALLAPPLSAIEPCHNTEQAIGSPLVRSREAPLRGGRGVRVTRTTRELRGVDREAGTARIRFERVDELHFQSTSEPADSTSTMRIECTVDLRSGMARDGRMEMTVAAPPPMDSTVTIRFEITVTPQ